MGAMLFSGWTGKIGTGSKPVNERAGGENGARPRGILGDLGFESVKARELLLWPNEIDERDAQVSPVKVHIGVEQVRLQPRCKTAHRRTQTNIGNAIDGAARERVIESIP